MLQANDLVLFYSDCQARYYKEEGWKVMVSIAFIQRYIGVIDSAKFTGMRNDPASVGLRNTFTLIASFLEQYASGEREAVGQRSGPCTIVRVACDAESLRPEAVRTRRQNRRVSSQSTKQAADTQTQLLMHRTAPRRRQVLGCCQYRSKSYERRH